MADIIGKSVAGSVSHHKQKKVFQHRGMDNPSENRKSQLDTPGKNQRQKKLITIQYSSERSQE